MITTTTSIPPQIVQYFNRYLLDPLYGSLRDLEDRLIPIANKKIRACDTGKRKEFDKLLKEYRETYERKKAEEAHYNAEINEKIKKRPSFPTTGKTMRFERVVPQK